MAPCNDSSWSPTASLCLISLMLRLAVAIIPSAAFPSDSSKPLSNNQLASAAGVIKGFLCISGKLIVKDPEHSDFRGCVNVDGNLLQSVTDSCPNFTVGKEYMKDPVVRVINVANANHILYCEVKNTQRAGDPANILSLECQDSNPADSPTLLWQDGLLGARKSDGTRIFNWARYSGGSSNNDYLALSGSAGYQIECENPVAESTDSMQVMQVALSKGLKPTSKEPKSRSTTSKYGPEYISTAPEHAIKLKHRLCSPGMLLLIDPSSGNTKGCVTRFGKIIHPVSELCNVFELGTTGKNDNNLIIINLKNPKIYRYCNTLAKEDMTLSDGTHQVAGTYINCKLERHPTHSHLSLLAGGKLVYGTDQQTKWSYLPNRDLYISEAGNYEIQCENYVG